MEGKKAAEKASAVCNNETDAVTLASGVLHHKRGRHAANADITLSLTRSAPPVAADVPVMDLRGLPIFIQKVTSGRDAQR